MRSNILYKDMIFFVYNILSVLIRPEQRNTYYERENLMLNILAIKRKYSTP